MNTHDVKTALENNFRVSGSPLLKKASIGYKEKARNLK